jgi:hypothetical protein
MYFPLSSNFFYRIEFGFIFSVYNFYFFLNVLSLKFWFHFFRPKVHFYQRVVSFSRFRHKGSTDITNLNTAAIRDWVGLALNQDILAKGKTATSTGNQIPLIQHD